MRIIIFLCVFAFSFSLSAQEKISVMDSLKLQLAIIDKDTNYAQLLLQIAEEQYYLSNDSMHQYSVAAYSFSDDKLGTIKNKKEKNAYKLSKALAINNIGSYYNDMGNIDTALSMYSNANDILKELGNKEGMGITLNNIGYIYNNFKVDIPKAIDYYEQSLKCFQDANLDYGIAGILNNLAYIYDNQGDMKKALDYFYQSLAIREKNKNKKGIAETLNNIGAAYQDLGDIDLALENYNRSLDIKIEIKDSVGMGYAYNNIASIYMGLKDYDKALQTHFLSLEIRKKTKMPRQIAESYGNVGLIYTLMDEYDEAANYLKKSTEMYNGLGVKDGECSTLHNLALNYQKVSDNKNALKCGRDAYTIAVDFGYSKSVQDASYLLYSVFKDQNQLDSALFYYEIYHQMVDSIRSDENIKAGVRMQTRYEIAKETLIKEQKKSEMEVKQAEKKSRRDNMQYTFIFMVILLLAGFILSIGLINVSQSMAQGLIFLTFLIFFEFLLVILDPWVDLYSGGAPVIKLGVNALVAALIFPIHNFFENRIKNKVMDKVKK